MDPKPNITHDFPNIVCDKDLVVENEILKVKFEKVDVIIKC